MEQILSLLVGQMLEQLSTWKEKQPNMAAFQKVRSLLRLYGNILETVSEADSELTADDDPHYVVGNPRIIRGPFGQPNDMMGGLMLAISSFIQDQRAAATIRNKISILETRLSDLTLDDMHRAEIHGQLMALFTQPDPPPASLETVKLDEHTEGAQP